MTHIISYKRKYIIIILTVELQLNRIKVKLTLIFGTHFCCNYIKSFERRIWKKTVKFSICKERENIEKTIKN